MGWGEPQQPRVVTGTVTTTKEDPLDRIAAATEQLVRLQSAPPPDIAAWLSRIDPDELNKAVLRRGSMATPPMESALVVLIDWARGVGP